MKTLDLPVDRPEDANTGLTYRFNLETSRWEFWNQGWKRASYPSYFPPTKHPVLRYEDTWAEPYEATQEA